MVKELCGRDPVMLVAFDRAMQQPAGNPNRDEATGRLAPSVDNINDRAERPTGTSAQAGIRRLRKEADTGNAAAKQALKEVAAGEIFVNGALVEMAARKKTARRPAERSCA